MSLLRVLNMFLAVLLALLVLVFVRMHFASGQEAVRPAAGNAEFGRMSAQARCTGCHSVQRETAGTGKFAPDFTAIATRRSARWLRRSLDSGHVLMPDFVFSRAQADDLVAYIVSLKRR